MYEGRGALKQFIVEALKARPCGITAPGLAEMIGERFNLALFSNSDLSRYIDNTDHSQVKKLNKEGLVECTPDVVNSMTLWEWRIAKGFTWPPG